MAAMLRGMHPSAIAAGRDLLQRFDFSRYRSVVDVGGGSGGIARDALPWLTRSEGDPVRSATHRRARSPDLEADARRRPRIDRGGRHPGEAAERGAHDAVVLAGLSCRCWRRPTRRARRHRERGGRAAARRDDLHRRRRILDDAIRMGPRMAVFLNLTFLNPHPAGASYTRAEHAEWLETARCADVQRITLPSGAGIVHATSRSHTGHKGAARGGAVRRRPPNPSPLAEEGALDATPAGLQANSLDTLFSLDDHGQAIGDVTMDVGEWLRSLDLGQYGAGFRDNGVDADVLPDLNDADLEKLGVLLGHRRRLLKAIANPAAPPPLVAPNAQPAPPPVESAERRHLTVMFCDLVGSTSISAKLDAEDRRDLVGGYMDAASAAVTRMGGHVAKKLGDWITALFGYPLAQENDAERALRAALEISARSPRSTRGMRTPGGRSSRRGSASRPARWWSIRRARCSATRPMSPPACRWRRSRDRPVLTAIVRRQVAGLFVAEDRGAHELKGVPGHGETYINHGARIQAPMI